uniref:Uncharacterized protein n=1 Tax=Myoviridae sp. ctj9o3 TaxID=2826688 RepID=A0A8S5MCZ7_9CAUD|nr:MAG TPA: hypothetical protein [Myoviridae sp. ctj9o3]
MPAVISLYPSAFRYLISFSFLYYNSLDNYVIRKAKLNITIIPTTL